MASERVSAGSGRTFSLPIWSCDRCDINIDGKPNNHQRHLGRRLQLLPPIYDHRHPSSALNSAHWKLPWPTSTLNPAAWKLHDLHLHAHHSNPGEDGWTGSSHVSQRRWVPLLTASYRRVLIFFSAHATTPHVEHLSHPTMPNHSHWHLFSTTCSSQSCPLGTPLGWIH